MPLYVYEHESKDYGECDERFEVLAGVNDPPLATCPTCGRPCHRVFSPFAPIKSTKDMLSTKNLERHGFTQYKRAGDGHYEKTCGEGPGLIRGDSRAMIEITIPGFGGLRLEHLVLDYNGTLACDGRMIPGVRESLEGLAGQLQLHVVTADTFGQAHDQLEGLPCKLVVLPEDGQDVGKLRYVQQLGSDRTVSIGNGRNDRLMLAEASLGIAVIEDEGAAADTLAAADVVCPGILSAFGLLTNPLRLTATLRS